MRVHIEPASPINISNKPQSSTIDRFGGGSVMVWAGISAQGKTDLHVIDNGTLTALKHVNEILDVYVRPYAGAIGKVHKKPGLVCKQDWGPVILGPSDMIPCPQSSVWNGQLDPRT